MTKMSCQGMLMERNLAGKRVVQDCHKFCETTSDEKGWFRRMIDSSSGGSRYGRTLSHISGGKLPKGPYPGSDIYHHELCLSATYDLFGTHIGIHEDQRGCTTVNLPTYIR